MAADDARADWTDVEEDDDFLMSNLFPRDTGLPMTVWIGDKGHARHDVRVKVNMIPGQRAGPQPLAVMSVRPEPQLLHGELSTSDIKAVAAWIKLNEKVILDHWNGEASTIDLARRLKRLPD